MAVVIGAYTLQTKITANFEQTSDRKNLYNVTLTLTGGGGGVQINIKKGIQIMLQKI